LKNNDFVNNLYAKIKADPNPRNIVRSIQISDPHIDFSYSEFTNAICDYPICCRWNGFNENTGSDVRLAGRWGDYNCDIPHETL